MKITSCCFVVAILVLVSLVVAEDAVKYAGTSDGAPTFNSPYISGGACTPGATAVPYVVFNHTWDTSGVRSIIAMAENKFKSQITTFVYSGAFDPTNPCPTTTAVEVLARTGSVPPIKDWSYFVAGTVYFFVITAVPGTDNTTGAASGRLAVNILPGLLYNATTWNSPLWPEIEPTTDGGDYSCTTYDNDYYAPYATYSWTQSTTGLFDLAVLFYNDSFLTGTYSWGGTYLALFSGNFLNPGNLSDPCNQTATGATFLNATYSNDFGTILYYIQLNAGTTYSIVFSGSDNDEFGYYTIQIGPTAIRVPNSSPSYTQPHRNAMANDTTCYNSDYTQAAWDAIAFVAVDSVYIIDQGVAPNYFQPFDSYSFMYTGNNSGYPGLAPSTCPLFDNLIYQGDTGDRTPMVAYTTKGETYTVVVSTYGGDSLTGYNYGYILYALTGLPIGTIPNTTTGGSTTGGQTSTGTTGKTSGTSTNSTAGKSSTSTSSGGAGSTTSAANIVQLPIALIALFVMVIFVALL